MCGSSKIDTILNLGKHPLVNRLIEKKDLKKKDYCFPLILKRCKSCSLMQLSQYVDPKNLYADEDYKYFSSDVSAQVKYFKKYSLELKKRFLKKKSFIVEIGSNDGIMLKHFVKKHIVLGIDPATNVVLRSLKRNVNSIASFFSKKLSSKILNEYGKSDLIIANNCVAHTNNLKDLILGIENLISKNGVFVAEFNYWGSMVKKNNYSLIYHEHLSFFSLAVWQKFLKKFKLKIFDALITDAQGGSLRIYCSLSKKKKTKRFKEILNDEKKDKINSILSVEKYKRNVLHLSKKLKKLTYNLKSSGKRIACYGAAAKGMTILKCSEIDKKIIDYFIDDSPAKQNLYSAGDHIPILSRKKIKKKLPDYFIISAPNFADNIIKKEKFFVAGGGKFIIPIDDIIIK